MLTALALAWSAPFSAACRAAETRADLSSVQRDEACYAFGRPHVMEGIYFDYFEGQLFVEGAHDVASADGPGVWIDQDLTSADRRRWGMAGEVCGHAYRIRFVGRSAPPLPAQPGRGYGHMGEFGGLVVVDRMLAVTDLGEVHHACGPMPSPQLR
jgi:hypothetical protein